MITMIGTGHVFRISEQVSFIVKYTWPDAVLVELDERRYASLMSGGDGKGLENTPKLYRGSAEYQNRISEKNGVLPGGEFTAAIFAGKIVGADIICIDRDAEQTMAEIEEGMSASERVRYSVSSVTDSLFWRKKINVTQKSFADNEEEYVRRMRRRFPTLVEKLIDERDAYMAERIRGALEKYNNIVVVVGDAHVRGICSILDGTEIEKIRLADMMNQERMDCIRSSIWNRKPGIQE
ncbi:MAG: TraB domain-containing protein [Candidatus Methanoplasma sp.]|jgi:pheromone shutdown protein TraB|nr:TraB domain-containing protein [Candidatus Methanoplasma sp.]